MTIGFQLRPIDKVKKYIATVPRGALRVGLLALGKYILGNSQHGLKHNEPYKYVSRKAAYGQTFFSDKQRRWFFANGGADMIGNNRTGKTADAWAYVETKGGYGGKFTNPTASAYFTRDEKGQARQPALVGWRKVSKVVSDNMAGAIRSANAAIKRYLQENK
jgi:hypothetical protein